MGGVRRNTEEARARRRVVIRTIQFLGLFGALTLLCHASLTSRLTRSAVVSLGVSFMLVQISLILLILGHVLVRKCSRMLLNQRTENVAPQMREDLAAYAAGREGPRRVEAWFLEMPDEFEACLVDFLPVLAGRRRRKLVALSGALGLVALWHRQYEAGGFTKRLDAITKLGMVAGGNARRRLRVALEDPAEELRLEAAKGLLRIGDEADVEHVFEFALSQSLLVRAVLAESLKSHVEVLAANVVPRLETLHDVLRLRRALEMITSWRVLTRFDALGRLLHHAEPGIVAIALRALPFVVEADRFRSEVLEGLVSARDEIRAAAAFAAGRMRMDSATDILTARLGDADLGVARAAADALVRIGSPGVQRLDDAVVGADRSGAGVALEALERYRTQRLQQAVGG